MTNLQRRLLTAAVGLPIVILAIVAGDWTFAVIFGVVIALAAIEFGHGWLMPSLSLREAFPRLWTFSAAGMMVGGTHADGRYITFGLVLAACFAVAGYTHTNRFGPRRPYRVQAQALIYLGLLGSTFVLTRDAENGRDWILLGILGTFAIDTGAYAVGRAIGRHKMAPSISPAKTWEGAVGGYIAGVAAVLGLNALLTTDTSAVTLLPFALVMPVLSQVGDLFESGMKRRMGVKDASGFLPGHGGFLDRLDSLLFVVPALYLFLRLRVL